MRTYVLDTNVLLHAPDAMFKFEDNLVVLPITVIEEVDKFKKDQNELGRNARQVSRNLDALRELGRLDEGVPMESGGTLKVMLVLHRILDRLPFDLNDNLADNRILAVAIDCKGTLISRDSNLRIKADALGIPAEDYKNDKISIDALYAGVNKLFLDGSLIDSIYHNKGMSFRSAGLESEPLPNECFVAHDKNNNKHSALLRYNSIMKEFNLLPNELIAQGITPRNTEQQFALSLLLDPSIKLITLNGKAGSGKGLISLAAALEMTLEQKLYKKIVIARPIISLNNGHQLGFMPGDEKDKLAQWLKPFYENINFILSSYTKPVKVKASPTVTKGKKNKSADYDSYDDEKMPGHLSMVDELIALDLLELASLESIKGRTFMDTIVLITEAQDCTLADVKAIVTRVGEGTKIILEGDNYQVDHPYLDSENNGLTYVAEKMKHLDLSAHITLIKSERSLLAELAAELL